MKLKYDELLSNVAFNFNVRRYAEDEIQGPVNLGVKVGRCRLTVSKPELKARLVSALETKM